MPFMRTEVARASTSVAGGTVAAPTYTVLATIRVPTSKRLVITAVASYANTSAAFGNPGLMMSIKVDGLPMPGFYRLRDQIGQQGQLQTVSYYAIKAESLVEFIAENDSATAYTAGWAWDGVYEDKK